MQLDTRTKGRIATVDGNNVTVDAEYDSDGNLRIRLDDPSNPDFWMEFHITEYQLDMLKRQSNEG